MKKIKIKLFDYDADCEVSTEVPAKNQMCPSCDGDGKVDNPAFSNGITQSERDEMGEEDFQSYMDGRYDVVCPCCKGAKIVLVPDVSQMTMTQKRFAVCVRKYDLEVADGEREYQAECKAERDFGC